MWGSHGKSQGSVGVSIGSYVQPPPSRADMAWHAFMQQQAFERRMGKWTRPYEGERREYQRYLENKRNPSMERKEHGKET